jgi:hypothetical protein
MSEYARSTDGAGKVYQFVDSEICMVFDRVTGEPQRFGEYKNATGTFEDALKFVTGRMGWEDRWAIIRLPAVCGFPVRTGAKHGD